MGSIQSGTMILGALGNRSASFLSRRAHLLTTPLGRWYFLRKSCARRGGCGRCDSLMDNATLEAKVLSLSTQLVCGKRSQNTVASTDGIPPTARTNLPPAALFAVMTLSSA